MCSVSGGGVSVRGKWGAASLSSGGEGGPCWGGGGGGGAVGGGGCDTGGVFCVWCCVGVWSGWGGGGWRVLGSRDEKAR